MREANKYRPDDAQICSCHNVTKGDIVEGVKSGTCKTIADVKSCTKAGTGCGGCMPLIQTIYSKTMAEMGQEVSNHCKSEAPTLSTTRSIRLDALSCLSQLTLTNSQYARTSPTHAQTFTTSSPSSSSNPSPTS